MDISKSILELRKKRSLKQKDACKLIGISQTYLSQLESGKKDASTAVICNIAKVYGVPASVIYFMAMGVKDIKPSKQKLFLMLKPIIDSMINEIIM